MAVKIRLKRMGAKKKPFYRVVVADSRSPRDGRFIQELGWFDPLKDPIELKLDVEAARKWIGNGAQPTDTARALLKKAGVFDAPSEETPDEEAPVAAEEAPAAEEAGIEEAVQEAPVQETEPAAQEPEAEADSTSEEPAPEAEADSTSEEPAPEAAAAEPVEASPEPADDREE